MKLLITFASLFLFIVSPAMAQVAIEKLDSVWYYDAIEEHFAGKTFYAYNALAQDTLIDAFSYDPTSESLEPNAQTLITMGDNEKTIEFLSFNNNAYQKEWLKTYQLDDNGETEEYIYSRWSPLNNTYEPVDKHLTTVRTAETVETEVYEWEGGSFQLKSLRVDQISSTEHISILSRNEDGSILPARRRTIRYDAETGVETLFRVENYDNTTQTWITSVAYTTVINTENNTGEKTRSILASSTDTELTTLSIATITYDDNWQVVVDIINDFDEGITWKFEYTYTERGNILSSSSSSLVDGDWVLWDTSDYFYTTFEVTPVAEPSSSVFPVDLVFQNPTTQNGSLRLASENNSVEPINLTITDLSGRTLSQQEVYTGQQIALSNYQLSAGLYFLTLRSDNQQKTWKLVVH